MLNNLRCIKSEREIELMRETCLISSKAHMYAMSNVLPGVMEYQISGLFQEYFAHAGADDNAYPSICGGGRNASILHYQTNTDRLKSGDLVLCDMGCKKNGMCSDITCTYPVSGTFSETQKEIYELVLEAQTSSIAMLKPNIAFQEVQRNAFMVILQGLTDLNLLRGDIQTMYTLKVHKVFMPHHLGHYLGSRTHDVGLQRRVLKPEDVEYNKQYLTIWEDTLQSNMCLTVEPGIYFIESLLDAAKENVQISGFFDFHVIAKYTHIGGVRIEDDLRITSDGYENFIKVGLFYFKGLHLLLIIIAGYY